MFVLSSEREDIARHEFSAGMSFQIPSRLWLNSSPDRPWPTSPPNPAMLARKPL